MTKVTSVILIVLFSITLIHANGDDFIESNLQANKLSSASSSKQDETVLKKRDSLMDGIRRLNSDNKGDPADSDNDSKSNEKYETDDNTSERKHKLQTKVTSFGFVHAFIASLSVIVVSEVGDKTFFIAAIMAMKHSRSTVYAGAMLALGLMTLLSALLGNILTKLIPRSYTYYLSSVLFALFGLKMLHEGWHMDNGDASEEYEEASSTLKENEEKSEKEKDVEASNGSTLADGSACSSRRFVIIFRKYLSPIFLQAFILTFLAEWGDRSQISTIILGARENIFGTVLGGVLGHGACTGLAVLGGRLIAQRISVRTVTLTGAFVFLFFAFSAFFIDPEAY